MNAKLIAQAAALRHTEERMLRVGLILDRAALSPESRRAMVALHRIEAVHFERHVPAPARIGFAYPNAR